jgi:NTP pyrophosphatase (non-canonical NTP hydrolase)
MEKYFNQLTPAEAERLALLAEEAAEVIQAVGKILRHGYESVYPAGGRSNRESLAREIGDFCAAAHLMCGAGDLNQGDIIAHRSTKLLKVGRFLHCQGVTPT